MNQGRSSAWESLTHSNVKALVPKPTKYMAFIAVFLTIALAFVCLIVPVRGHVEATGVVTASNGVEQVYAPVSGVLSNIFVTEGQSVKAGEPLFMLSLDKFANSPSKDSVQRESMISLVKSRDRLMQQITEERELAAAKKEQLAQKERSLKERMVLLQDHVAIQKERIDSAERQLHRYVDAESKGLIPRQYAEDKQDALLQQRGEYISLANSLNDADQELRSTRIELRDSELTSARTESELYLKLESIKTDIAMQRVNASQVVMAPSNGRVGAILVDSGYAEVSKPVLSLIPDKGRLEITLYVPIHKSVLLEQKQIVAIRYSSLPYQRFGTFSGHVSEISPVAIRFDFLPDYVRELLKEDRDVAYYRVRVIPDSPEIHLYGSSYKITLDTPVTAWITTGSHTLIRWLLDPLFIR